jgi:LysM repeat protein
MTAVSMGYDFPKSHLRLTKRGRAVFTTLVALPLVIAAFVYAINGGSATATMDDAPAQSYEYVTVVTGQSLWAVAGDIAPAADPRDVVAEILSFNGLSSADLFPGQRLALPPEYS